MATTRQDESKALRDEAKQDHAEAMKLHASLDEATAETRGDIEEGFNKAMDAFDTKTAQADAIDVEEGQVSTRQSRLDEAAEKMNTVVVRSAAKKITPDEIDATERKYDSSILARIITGNATPEDRSIYGQFQTARFATMLEGIPVEHAGPLLLQLRDTLVTDTTAGGVIVPTEVANQIDVLVALGGPMVNPQVVTFIDNLDVKMNLPSFDATGASVTGGAQDTASTEGTLTIGALELDPHEYQTNHIPVSLRALQQQGSMLNQFFAEWIGQSFALGINKDATDGNGTNKIAGVLNAFVKSGVGTDASLRRLVEVKTADTVLYADAIKLLDNTLADINVSGPKSFVLMHRSFAGALAEKRTSGVRQWHEYELGSPSGLPTLRGVPVRYNNALDAGLDADADIPMIAGNFSAYVIGRGSGGIRVRTDQGLGAEFARNNILVKGLASYDGGRLQNKAFAALQNKA